MISFDNIIAIIDKICYNKYIYHIIALVYILTNISCIEHYNLHSKKSWILFLSISIVFGLLSFIVKEKRNFPKFKKDDIGIIFSIDTENETQSTLINKKFVKAFQQLISSKNEKYKVIMLNKYMVEKIDNTYIANNNIETLCQKTNGKFFIYGRSVSGNEKEKISCKIHLEGAVFHEPISYGSHLFLTSEASTAFKPIMNIEIYKDTETDDFELNALQLNLAFHYILASTHIVLGDFDKALEKFLFLKRTLNETERKAPVINFVRKVVDDRICLCYNQMAAEEMDKYFEDEKASRLPKIKTYLDESFKHFENSYNYKLLIAIYYFISNRDIKTALKHIEDCKNVKTNDGWKFSKVFLKLYQSDSMTNFLFAYKTYDKCFAKSKLTFDFVNNIIEFIIKVLEKEPDKKQLNYLLFLLYYYIDDKTSMYKYYTEFKNNYSTLLMNDNFRQTLVKLGMLQEDSDEDCLDDNCSFEKSIIKEMQNV